MFLTDALRKFGLAQTLRDKFRAGSIFYDLASVLVNGTDRTSIELTRLGEINRVKNRLGKRYKEAIAMPLDKEVVPELPEAQDTVWTLWLQGEENAPEIVRMSLASQHKYCEKLVVLNASNLEDYIKLPDFIIERWHDGYITDTFLSDLIRIEVLLKYGGIWMDATVLLCSKEWMLPEISKSRLFFFQNLRPGSMGNAIYLSSWFIKANPKEPSLLRVQELLYRYIKDRCYIEDYFVFHIFWHLVLEAHPVVYDGIPKFPNSVPLQLMFVLNKELPDDKILDIEKACPIQKLTYKGLKNDKKFVHSRLIEMHEIS